MPIAVGPRSRRYAGDLDARGAIPATLALSCRLFVSADGRRVLRTECKTGAIAEAAERRGELVRSGEVHRFRAPKK